MRLHGEGLDAAAVATRTGVPADQVLTWIG